jgi:hypothetical protein
MIIKIILSVIFALLINWSVSLQILNQVASEKKTKWAAVSLAIASAIVAGVIAVL